METRPQTSSRCLRVVLYGPESTGKTTLAKALADHYQTVWVPEFARPYLQEKWDKEQAVCTLDDLPIIAQGQLTAENAAIQKANKLILCDTNILVTKVWSETHFKGYCAPELNTILAQTHYDLYLLTSIDVPWEKDDLRDRPNDREQMFIYFKQQLVTYNFPFLVLEGNPKERVEKAVTAIDQLLEINSTKS
jgi:NadR type nicotinamide-nucleotide adenylyltransferase